MTWQGIPYQEGLQKTFRCNYSFRINMKFLFMTFDKLFSMFRKILTPLQAVFTKSYDENNLSAVFQRCRSNLLLETEHLSAPSIAYL